jgi:ADP-ribose pyrophosphatase
VERAIRYQGAIIRDGLILLVKQRGDGGYAWWNVPGGGREANETEEQCVVREMKEETNLDVKIECLLIDGPSHRHSPYQQFKTYLCTVREGIAQSNGVESIAVKWFDLKDESQWSLEVVNNETTYVMLQRISDAMANNPQ